MSGKSSTGFNRSGGGAADGSGGFATPGGSKLADGTEVRGVFLELEDALKRAGYAKTWVDGWKRGFDGAVVTAGYSYREVRVRRYVERNAPGPQAIHDVKGYADLDPFEAFVGPPVGDWGDWSIDVHVASMQVAF